MGDASHDAVDGGKACFKDFKGLDISDLVDLVAFFDLIVFTEAKADMAAVGSDEVMGFFPVIQRDAPGGTVGQTVFPFEHTHFDHQIFDGVFAQFVFTFFQGVLG